MPDDRVPASLYEQDFSAWALSQAASIRAAGNAVLGGESQAADVLRALDWDNLAEEIEGLARKDRRKLRSRLAVIVEHLIKLEFSPAEDPRVGWSETILRERARIGLILRDSPSLKPAMPEFLNEVMAEAVELAASALELYGETTAAHEARSVRSAHGYSLDEVMSAWLPKSPSA